MQYDIEDFELPSFEELVEALDKLIGKKRKKDKYACKQLPSAYQLTTGFVCTKIARIDDEVVFVDDAERTEHVDYCSAADITDILSLFNKHSY